ncbi:MAG: extracellular solute-binding protein [Gammaproteobacteria bacterium]|nr:extracellular solute-binding protein [Gammaproteobacteria bacterium]
MKKQKRLFLPAIMGLTLGVIAQPALADMDYLKGVDGKLSLYCAVNPDMCEGIVNHFNRAVAKAKGNNDFKAGYVRLSTSELTARVKGELASSRKAARRKCEGKTGTELESCKENVYQTKVDVAFGGTNEPYLAAIEDDLFSLYSYPTDNSVQSWAAEFTRSSGNRLGAMYLGILGLAVNNDVLAKAGASTPTGWTDLAKPEYKGLIAVANANTSGTSYKYVSTILQIYGSEAKGWDQLVANHKNMAQYTKSGSKPGKMAAAGEIGIGVGFMHDIVHLKQKGFPVEPVAPVEGTNFEIGPIAIIRGTKNRKNAEIFVKFLYEQSTQAMFPDVGMLQFPSNASTPVPKGAPDITKIKLIDGDPKYSTKAVKNEVVTKWTREIFPLPR